MRKCMVLCAVCAIVGLLASVAMADSGLPSAGKMQQMGLSSTTIVSDSVAMDVRGFGWHGKKSNSSAKAWGSSKVKVEVDVLGVEVELEAKNGHEAKGEHIAVGGNLSVVGVVIGGAGSGGGDSIEQINGNGGWGVAGGALFAGGFSGAYAR